MGDKGLVVVTGATGFVGKYVIADLLRAGYRVRGTLRDVDKADGLREVLQALSGTEGGNGLELMQADILSDDNWPQIMAGADAVMHVATTVLAIEPEDADVVVRPAVEGTERVLRFAHAAGIKRVIMTSSIATIGYGLGLVSGVRVFTEADFTNLEAMDKPWAYCVGKTRAERAAWLFARENGLELTTIHPGAILGPASDPSTSVSLGMVIGLLTGRTQAVLNTGFSIIDVRDVAAMHRAALENPQSIGERYLATDAYTRFIEVADILRAAYPERNVTDRIVPDEVILGMIASGKSASQIVNDIGNEKHFDGAKGRALLGRDYIPAKQAVLAAAESALRHGLVPALESVRA